MLQCAAHWKESGARPTRRKGMQAGRAGGPVRGTTAIRYGLRAVIRVCITITRRALWLTHVNENVTIRAQSRPGRALALARIAIPGPAELGDVNQYSQ